MTVDIHNLPGWMTAHERQALARHGLQNLSAVTHDDTYSRAFVRAFIYISGRYMRPELGDGIYGMSYDHREQWANAYGNHAVECARRNIPTEPMHTFRPY